MANYIPILSFGPEEEWTVVFDTPPEGDPLGETVGTEKEQIRSVGGRLFTADFYDYRTFSLKFILQNNALALKLKNLFETRALRGESFRYFPHSDDESISFDVELESESVSFNRDHPDGQSGFLWSFEFTLISVTKTAPRVIRVKRDTEPEERAPGPVQNLVSIGEREDRVRVSWDAPADTGTSPLQKYETRQGTDGDVVNHPLSLPNFFTEDHLTASTQYTFYVRAVNEEGLAGPWTSTSATTLASIPDISAVQNLRTTELLETQATVEWDEPATTGGRAPLTYQIQFTTPSGAASPVAGTSATLRNLTAGTAYVVRVRAVYPRATPGPWTSLNFTTAETPQQNVPGHVRNVVLRGPISDVTASDRLVVQFDWPGEANDNTITAFKIYTYPLGFSTRRQLEQVRTVDVSGVTDRTGKLTFETATRFRASRPHAVTYACYVVATNGVGDSIGASASNFTLPRTYPKNFFENRIDDNGDYVYTDDFGEQDNDFISDANFSIDLSSSVNWRHSGSYPDYSWSRSDSHPSPLMCFGLSRTDKREMAVAGYVHRRTNTTVDTRVLLLRQRSDNTYTPETYIASSGHIFSMTSFIQEFSGVDVTRWIYLKYGDPGVFVTAKAFSDADNFRVFNMTHYSYASQYTNTGCSIIGNYLYVLNWWDNRVYVYDVRDGSRQTSREFTIGTSYAFPRTSWTNGKFIWFLGSSALSTTSTNVDKVYCLNVAQKRRETAREFMLGTRSNIISASRKFAGVGVAFDRFIVGTSIPTNKQSFRAYSL